MLFPHKLKQPKLLTVSLLLLTLLIGIVIGTVVNTGVRAQKQNSAAAPDATPLTVPPSVTLSNDFTKLAKKLQPSVVYIESDYLAKPTKHTGHSGNEGDDSGDGPQTPSSPDPSDVFKHFFGKPDPRSFRSEGSGTGFIVDRNGYIITNNHVIDKADRIKVKVSGEEEEYRGKVVGVDPETDVAVLRIESKRTFTPVQVGNSDSVEVGDWAIAIGSPFGLQATVTAGIVSATGRDLGSGQFQHFLQTDAAINPGNSGGPLLNIRGEVIGINTMIATRSGSYEGIGFALPSNMAVKVYNDIIHDGRVIRGSIGISWSKNGSQPDTLHAFGLDHGVLVDTVAPKGPAGRAGLKADDIILAINDHPVKDGDELVNKVADMPVGSNALLTVDREGKRMDFKVGIEERTVVWKDSPQVGEVKPPGPAVIPDAPKSATPAPVKFGITIMNLKEKERQDLGISDKSGVKVVSVDPGSFADDIGLQENDAILAVNRMPVTTPDDITKMQKVLKPGAPVALHVVRSIGSGGRRTPPNRIYLSGRLPVD
jgi:serine protease Do